MNSWFWNPPPRSAWRRLLLESVVIVALGVIVGLSVNVELLRRVLRGEQQSASHKLLQQEAHPEPVMLEELRELLDAGALAVDARLPEQYAEGHLPQAVNLPLAEVEVELDGFLARVEPSRVLAIYCNGYGCADSFDLAEILVKRGFTRVRVYEGGFPEWSDSGLPVEKGALK